MSGSSFFSSSSEEEHLADMPSTGGLSSSPHQPSPEKIKCRNLPWWGWFYGGLLLLASLGSVFMAIVLWRGLERAEEHAFSTQASMAHLQHAFAAQRHGQETHKETFQHLGAQLDTLTKMLPQKQEEFYAAVKDALKASHGALKAELETSLETSLDRSLKKVDPSLKEREGVRQSQDLILAALQKLLDQQGGEKRVGHMQQPSSTALSFDQGNVPAGSRSYRRDVLREESPQKLQQLFEDSKEMLPPHLVAEFSALPLSQWMSLTVLGAEVRKALTPQDREEVVHTPWEKFLDKFVKIRRIASYRPTALEQGVERLIQAQEMRAVETLWELLPEESRLRPLEPSIRLMVKVQRWLDKMEEASQEKSQKRDLPSKTSSHGAGV